MCRSLLIRDGRIRYFVDVFRERWSRLRHGDDSMDLNERLNLLPDTVEANQEEMGSPITIYAIITTCAFEQVHQEWLVAVRTVAV